MTEPKSTAVGIAVTEREREILRALAYVEGRSVSDILYSWVKPRVLEAGRRDDVKAVLEQRVTG